MDAALEKLLGLLKEASTLVSSSVAPPPPFKPPTDTPAATAAGGAKGGNKRKGEQPDKKGASKSRCVAADSAIKQAVQVGRARVGAARRPRHGASRSRPT